MFASVSLLSSRFHTTPEPDSRYIGMPLQAFGPDISYRPAYASNTPAIPPQSGASNSRRSKSKGQKNNHRKPAPPTQKDHSPQEQGGFSFSSKRMSGPTRSTSAPRRPQVAQSNRAQPKKQATEGKARNHSPKQSTPYRQNAQRPSPSKLNPPSSLIAAVQPGAPFELRHNRTGTWETIDCAEMRTPKVPNAASPITQRHAKGQSVTLEIKGQNVAGVLAGFDYKGRPVIIDEKQQRRIGEWEQLESQGPARSPETPYTGLTAGSVTKPPAKLLTALESALEIKVTGEHTAREYIDALQSQGYSVFLCGGAIRDAIYALAKDPKIPVEEIAEQLKDVDIVTNAPPPLVREICEKVAPEYEGGAVWSPPMVEQFGAVLVGGPKAGLDNPEGLDIVSMRVDGMFEEQQTNEDTGEKAFPYTFGSSLKTDSTSRDFHCNSIYYDPFNQVTIEPAGTGIADAQNKFLRISRGGDSSKDDNLSLRYFKFRMRGYTTDSKNLGKLRKHANAALWGQRWKVVSNLARIAPKDAQSDEQIDAFFDQLGEVMKADGCETVFRKRVLKLKEEVRKRIQKRFKKVAISNTNTSQT